MTKIEQLQAALKEAVDKAKKLRADLEAKAKEEKRALTVDEVGQINKDLDEFDALKKELDEAVAADDATKRQVDAEKWLTESAGRRSSAQEPLPGSQPGRAAPSEEQRALALQAWLRYNSHRRMEPTAEQADACAALNFNFRASELCIRLADNARFRGAQSLYRGGYSKTYAGIEERALSAVTGATGGFTVPETLVRQLEINMLAYGSVMQAAEVIRTASGERMTWPTANDTSNKGRQIGENLAVTSTAQPAFGTIGWDAYKFTSDEILVPTELLEDSAFDIASVIGAMLGERIGRILEEKFTTGNGAGTPKGIVNASTLGKTTAGATAITWAEVTDLIHSVDPAYRTGAAFMFHDGIYQWLRKFSDGFGRPMWSAGPNETPPPLLQGFPYFVNQEMQATLATGTKTILFGRLNMYKIRQVNEIRMYRLIEAHRENDQDAFVAFVRADGNLLNAGTAPVKHMLQL